MALVTCYTPEGVEVQKEYVDVMECVKHGGFTLKPIDPVVEAANKKIREDMKGATIADMKKYPAAAEAEADMKAYQRKKAK